MIWQVSIYFLPLRRVIGRRRPAPCSWVWGILPWSSVSGGASCAPAGRPRSSTPSRRCCCCCCNCWVSGCCCCWLLHLDSTCASTGAIADAHGRWRQLSVTRFFHRRMTRRKTFFKPKQKCRMCVQKKNNQNFFPAGVLCGEEETTHCKGGGRCERNEGSVPTDGQQVSRNRFGFICCWPRLLLDCMCCCSLLLGSLSPPHEQCTFYRLRYTHPSFFFFWTLWNALWHFPLPTQT